jgi:hypothetical protein
VPNADPNYIDLYDLDLVNEPSFEWRDGSMHAQEAKIKGELDSLGYITNQWRNGEADSFGPLSRELPVTTPKGDHKIVVYG